MTVAAIATDASAEQLPKARSLICVTVSASATDASDLQPKKTSSPIHVSEAGIATSATGSRWRHCCRSA